MPFDPFRLSRRFQTLQRSAREASHLPSVSLPGGALRRRPGPKTRQLVRARASEELLAACGPRSQFRRVTDDKLPPKRSRSYRQVELVAREAESDVGRASRTLTRVLRGHPEMDARAHAAFYLRNTPSESPLRDAAERALLGAYRRDPAIAVREAAYRTLRHLANGRAWHRESLSSPRALWRQTQRAAKPPRFRTASRRGRRLNTG
jgi:hypothetical protein